MRLTSCVTKDHEGLLLCVEMARLSPDPSTQVGAVLVSADGKVVASGNNTFPHNVEPLSRRLIRPEKYLYVEHAERNVIYQCAHKGIATKGSTLYTTWGSCAACARALVQAGVTRMVTLLTLDDYETSLHGDTSWLDSLQAGRNMLREAGVMVSLHSAPLETSLLFNGKIIAV